MNDRSHTSGFTMLELVVVLAVVAVLAGVAAPSMNRLRQEHRMQGLAEELLGSLMLARAEALRHQQRVTVCVRSADEGCAASGPWTAGWIVFVDSNDNAQRDSQEVLLQKHSALPTGLQLVGNTTVSRYVSYGPEGRSMTLSGAFQAGTLSLCQEGADQAWDLVINALGKPRLVKVAAEGCD